MAYIGTLSDAEVSGPAAEAYEADRGRLGYVANYTRLFANRPAVYAAWQQLNGSIKASMDLRRYELATVAAARRMRSSYCALAHGKVLAERFFDPGEVVAIVTDRTAAGLQPVDVAVMDLAEKVADDATAVTAADIERLRSHGLSDADIFDVVVAASARCFFSKTLEALGAEPDPVYSALEPEMRDALTVGRPIATS
jgi:uncharacterized peroxidase-related enzyme